MRRIKYLLRFFLLFLLLGDGMSALAENDDRVADKAGLLTAEEEEKLEAQFARIAEKYQCDVVVLTTDTLEGKSPRDYTDDYYYQNHYGYGTDISGIILMVSMEERDWWMATRGRAISIFTDAGQEQLRELFLNYLSNGEYYRAFRAFGNGAEDFMEEAAKGTPYDTHHTYKAPMGIGLRLLIACGTGLVLAGASLAVLYAQLASVRGKREAQDYVRSGSFRVTRARDLFLYRTVHRRKIERESSTSGGGSSTYGTSDGGRAGGSGGKF